VDAGTSAASVDHEGILNQRLGRIVRLCTLGLHTGGGFAYRSRESWD
jgi:hypothetical protein